MGVAQTVSSTALDLWSGAGDLWRSAALRCSHQGPAEAGGEAPKQHATPIVLRRDPIVRKSSKASYTVVCFVRPINPFDFCQRNAANEVLGLNAMCIDDEEEAHWLVRCGASPWFETMWDSPVPLGAFLAFCLAMFGLQNV